MDKIYAYEAQLTGYLFEQLAQIPEIVLMAHYLK
jgi:cysteine desulfurase/selenocysteine lyase